MSKHATTGSRRFGRPAVRTVRTGVVGVAAVAVTAFVVASAVVPIAAGETEADRSSRGEPATATPAAASLNDSALGHPATSRGVDAAVLPAHPPEVTPKLISRLAANGIPTTALNAYRVAAARVDHAEPACNLHWPLLAGIGRVESDHGQAGGAVLLSSGRSSPRIIGPALNGTAGNRSIPAPVNGVSLDGDAVYAHALGPMQFIPSTWAVYGTDADGDGTADIFDIDDAALAAARYLCAAGGNLTTYANRVRAVFSYNNLHAYVAEVLGLAFAYRTGTTVTGLPVGDLTGTLAPLGTSPVNAAGLTDAQRRARARQRAVARQRARQNPLTLVPGGTKTPTATASPRPSKTGPTKTRPTKTRTAAPRPTPTPVRSTTPPSTSTVSPTPTPTPTETGE